MNYVIAIPTYNRVKELGEKTLALLERHHISKDNIFLFVVEEEREAYKNAYPTYQIITGVLGLGAQKNFIVNYFPLDTKIVKMDDDVEDVWRVRGAEKKKGPIDNLHELIVEGFTECENHNRRLWGVTVFAHYNSRYMEDRITITPAFCTGSLYGFFNNKFNGINSGWCEDKEYCLEYSSRDRGIVLFKGVACKTKIGAPGGLNKKFDERKELHIADMKVLADKYPQLVKVDPKKADRLVLSRKKLIAPTLVIKQPRKRSKSSDKFIRPSGSDPKVKSKKNTDGCVIPDAILE
jgi:hypothetical protein